MMKKIFSFCILVLAFFLAYTAAAQEGKYEKTKDDVMSLPPDSRVLPEREKAVAKIREMLAQGPEIREGIEGFVIEGDAPDGEILVNGVKLEELEAKPMAELLVALAEKFYVESKSAEELEETEEENEEMARMREIQEQNERLRQMQSIQRTQEMMRQSQMQSQRPPAPPTPPASRPPSPPTPPAAPVRR